MDDNPKLKFVIKPQNDLMIYNGFLETAEFFDMEKDLAIGFYNPYPGLKIIVGKKIDNKQKVRLVKDFIDGIYKKERIKIFEGVKKAERRWKAVENRFFKKVAELFKKHNWPCGDYNAFVTIWGTFPRFLKDKSFTFPYEVKNRNFVIYVILHEMMHFIFYNYVIKKHPSIFKKLETENGIFWDLAEIFNVVILSSPKFIRLHGYEKVEPYLQHKIFVKQLKKYWQEKGDIDSWIIKSLNYLKSKN